MQREQSASHFPALVGQTELGGIRQVNIVVEVESGIFQGEGGGNPGIVIVSIGGNQSVLIPHPQVDRSGSEQAWILVKCCMAPEGSIKLCAPEGPR